MYYNRLAEMLFPDITETPEYYEEKYPPRNLPEGAIVTRLAPSPTGFVHLGNILQGLTSERMAHQSGGVLFLRIEDTDAKREVKGAVKALIDGLKYCGITFDEGATADGDFGSYGPYRQRQRVKIYHCYAKVLVQKGMAYPCFATAEELDEIRNKQQELKCDLGYYGQWAKWRDRSIEDIQAQLDKGTPWVLRFRTDGNRLNKHPFDDLIKGRVEITENDIDHVLLKSDGIPTYHFAHAVDDHLMRTTHVVRGDEWLPSLPFHIQLFKALDFKLPKYLHIGPLMKMDGTSKRKLSKRKDPEIALSFYKKMGYPVEAINEYMLTILNSNFEDWRRQNPDKPIDEFKFSYKKMNPAGSLFDEAKFRDVSKNVISKFTAERVFESTLNWAEEFDKPFADVLSNNKERAINALNIGRGGNKPRKDIAAWSEVKDYIGFIFDECFEIVDNLDSYDKADVKAILTEFVKTYSAGDDQNTWFAKIKENGAKYGYCPDMKEYKANPENYKGSVADVSSFIRIAVTGRLNSPDLYAIMQIIGEGETVKRIDKFKETL